MSILDHDSWDIEEEGCIRLSRQLQIQVQECEEYQDLSPIYDRLTVNLDYGLEQMRKDIASLRSKLKAATTWATCSPPELDRRASVLDKLSNEWKAMYETSVRTSREGRRPHFDENAGAARDNWNEALGGSDPTLADGIASGYDPTTFNKVSGAFEALKKRQIEIMQDQNRGLESLSQTLSRQRNLASQLGQEVEDQNDVLDNLATTMGRVESGVQRETGNISQVNRRDGTCGYWVVIIGLMVAIVVVAFL